MDLINEDFEGLDGLDDDDDELEFNQATAHEPNGTHVAWDTGVQLSSEASKAGTI